MTDAGWKLVVDQQGVTIASDRFQLTANGSQPVHNELSLDDAMLEAAGSSHMEAIVAELQSMTRRTYGQFCGLAHAIEIVGERWAMLIIRDLLVGAKNFDDLYRGFPRMPIDVLCTRLKELEHNGIVRRYVAPEANGTVVYELTEYGRELDGIAVALARWGAQSLGEPRPEDVVTADSLVMALRSTFRAEARDMTVSYELRFGDVVIHARIDDGILEAAEGPMLDADLIIETGPVIRALMAGDTSPAEAIANGGVQLTGDPGLLTRFVEVFRIPRPSARPA